ncbi:TVG1119628 [Thermoplasma volcanium GSS1]|uniref:TVG1119628 protein n=1 Tax=Thermoplasma volcanium (strain ATCC 51530 / DSM 4299 / JCM 9571 / NBRC 15438 / GSS1) TaxID=273116 RepID=Q979S1_THEVO|nr:hypothetical protein [Thermoplasma volcanium]BAB60231.1 TVG1119628 [Thermoplasma volcanium GSS1]
MAYADYGKWAIVVNIGVMAPPLAILLYVMPRTYIYANIAVFLIFSAAPFIRRILRKPFMDLVYPIAVLVVSASIIIGLLLREGLVKNKYYVLATQLNEPFMVSISLAVAVITLVEGIFATKLYSVITLMAFSTLSTLDLLAALTVQSITGYPFFTSFFYVELMEYEALFTLVFYGYEYSLPLATFAVPINSELIAAFIISLASIIVRSYMNGNRSIDRIRSFAFSIFYGSIIGVAAVYVVNVSESFNLQFLLISVIILLMVYFVIKTSKPIKKKDRNSG